MKELTVYTHTTQNEKNENPKHGTDMIQVVINMSAAIWRLFSTMFIYYAVFALPGIIYQVRPLRMCVIRIRFNSMQIWVVVGRYGSVHKMQRFTIEIYLQL